MPQMRTPVVDLQPRAVVRAVLPDDPCRCAASDQASRMNTPLMVFHHEPGSALSPLERRRLEVSMSAVQSAMFDAAGRGAPIPERAVVWFHATISETPRRVGDIVSGIEVRAVRP